MTASSTPIDDRHKQELADRLATALDLDVTRRWSRDFALWTPLPKAALIAAIETAPCTTRLDEVDRAGFLKMLSRKTKDDLATSAAQVLEGTGWLPALFVAPQVEPQNELTDAGVAALGVVA